MIIIIMASDYCVTCANEFDKAIDKSMVHAVNFIIVVLDISVH